MKIGGIGIPELTILLMPAIIVGAICCAICYTLGKRKGYTPAGFGAMGFFLGVIGLIIALVLPDKNDGSHRAATADSLLKYKELLDKGVISQEEFEAKKNELLK